MKRFFLLATLLLVACFATKADPTNYLTFNGTDQYVDIPTTDDLSMTSTQSLSLSFWVKADNSGITPRVLVNRYNMSDTYGCLDVFYGGSGCAIMFISTDGSDPMNNYLGGTPGEWTHIVGVFNRTDGTVQAYANGSEVTLSGRSLATTDLINSPVNTTLGVGLNTSGTLEYYLQGAIANVRYYRGALTAAQAVEDMNANSYSALSSDLKDMCVAAYDLTDSYESLTLTDATGRGNDGELVNYADPTADSNITDIIVSQTTNKTGRTNEQDIIISANVKFEGASSTLSSMEINLDGTTDINDIVKVKIYGTGSVSSFDEREVSADATLLAEVTPAEGTITCDLSNATLSAGDNYIWITVEVADDATEGNTIDASLISLTTDNGVTAVSDGAPTGSREIILAFKVLHMYGDSFEGTTHTYRIPAMDILPNGNIITAYDLRPYPTEYDLPNDISVYGQISEDGGYTWSDPILIAAGGGTESTGRGDAALLALNNDTIVIAFAGDNGLSASTADNPISQYIVRSFDGGYTWTDAIKGGEGDFTSVVFDNMYSSKKAAFFSSGKGIELKRQTGTNASKNGRIMFVTAAGAIGSLENYVVYSDDRGATWNLSDLAFSAGDESKVTELNDGTVLMSIRRSGARGYSYSYDGGETWSNTGTWSELTTNACNGDILEYTTLVDGYSMNRTIQSLPTNDGGLVREKVTTYISYDEGQTWSTEKQLFDAYSGYSTMVRFDDGTIGMYVEEQPVLTPSQTNLVFMRFSLEWMTSGKDKYIEPGILSAATPTFSPESGTSVEVGGTMTVTISCETENSTIYYTTDGSNPSADNGMVYTGEITVSGGDIITAIAIADGYEYSAVASATYPERGYCTTESQCSVTYRYLNSVTFTGGEESFYVSGIESATTRDVYKDLTDNVLLAEAGATISPTISWEGEWMHGYIYIDYNNDSEFTAVLADNGGAADDSELVSFTYYDATEASTGVNSKGESSANSSRLDNVPSFTLPSDLAAGTYRLRVNIDWNCLDACGTADIAANGGSITDFTLQIDAPTGVESVYGENISVIAGTGSITVNGEGAVDVKVYNTQGGVVKDTVIINSGSISLSTGVYLVQINGKTSKVIVK